MALLGRSMPPLFVLIWATGFVLARLVAPQAKPLTFLSLRHACSFPVFAGMALAARAAWTRTVAGWRGALVTGVLMQDLFLAGVFWSVRHGLPAGIAAQTGGLQALMTAMLSYPGLRQPAVPGRWLGIALGFLGAAPMLASSVGAVGDVPSLAPAVRLAGTVAMTLGTI